MAPEEKSNPKVDVEAPKKSKTLLIIIILIVALAGGGVSFYFLGYKKKADAEAEGDTASETEGDAETEEGHPTVGHPMPIEAFVVNLDDESGNRYLKVEIVLESKDPPTEESKRYMPRLRDELLLYLSKLTVEETLRHETKIEVKKKALEIGKKVFGKKAIVGAYLREFVIQ